MVSSTENSENYLWDDRPKCLMVLQDVPLHEPKTYQMSSTNVVLQRHDLIGSSKSSSSSSSSTIGSYRSSSSSGSYKSSLSSGSVLGSSKSSSTDDGSVTYKLSGSDSTVDNDNNEFDTNANLKDSDMVEQTSQNESTTSSGCLSDSYDIAVKMLSSSQIDEAEKQFLFLYQQMQEKSEDTTQILVQTLNGLADVCTRRSRMCRSNPMEWQWLCMHAIALLQYTMEICDSELETEMENDTIEWYTEQKQALEQKCKPLEDSLNRALYNCMKHEARKYLDPFRSFSVPNTPGTPSRSMFPLSTGNKFNLYSTMHSQIISKTNENQSADDSHTGLSWLSKFHEYCNDRLQTKNIGTIFNRLFLKKQVQSKHDNDDAESAVSGGSLDWDHSDLDREICNDVPVEEEKESPVKEHSLGFELAASDINNEGWDFFLGDRKNCTFESVVQVASNPHHINGPSKNDIIDIQRRESIKEKEVVSPLHDHSIKLTLTKCYAKLADKLMTEEDYANAEVIYEQVLEIVDEIQDGTAGMLRFYARLLKNCGTAKSKQGKMSQGLKLLNKALETYRDLQDDEANFEIALALLELGNGYVTGRDKDNAVFSYAIGAICEFFEKDGSDDITSSTSSSKSEFSSPEKIEEEQNIDDAIQCYKEALHLLRNHESQREDKQSDLVARSTRRLADCYFMQKEYDKALECYEKSLSMLRNTPSVGRDLVLENAHVLCMLGVSSFMLLMFPRAASTFELALHMVKYAFSLKSTFFHGLLLALMGITFYKMRNYHRCVSMCYQAFEIFCALHGDKLPELPKHKFWLVCQVLYVMGNSYNNLNLHQKAIKYLSVARSVLMASRHRDRRQFMRVLQILGDCYFAQYDYKSALQFYNEALEYGDCESQISFNEVFDANANSDEMSMHNQLVSKSAEAHISMQQYQNAVHYLEQAHDMQETMGDDIKGDLAATLHSLGQMYCGAGDVDKAIDSYNESLEVYREIHNGNLGPEVVSTLGDLAAMCYVKACLCDDVDSELEMIVATEKYFQEALALGKNPVITIRYANFLFSQNNYVDAVKYLKSVLEIEDIETAPDLVYGGLEKVTLPDVLQDEVDCQEEVVLPPSSLARYLLILSHKNLGHTKLAEDNLIDLLMETLDYDIPILYSVLGYSMMEMGVIEEAIWCFGTAVSLENDYRLAIDNFCTCVCIWVLQTLERAVGVICTYYGIYVSPMYLSTTSESIFSYSTYLI
ncbi:uncharacterized protein LOC143073469 isoform X1 [Mytilus galloprovincialis]|uniref:uncharacterized protein LOC143073469 isoform X1 n=1 Tax=Mytilus galloprovincialis TaxID=29158 RepID=UPI003F7BD8D7